MGVVSVVTWSVVFTAILVVAMKFVMPITLIEKADASGCRRRRRRRRRSLMAWRDSVDLVELGEKTYDDAAEQREQKLSPQQVALAPSADDAAMTWRGADSWRRR